MWLTFISCYIIRLRTKMRRVKVGCWQLATLNDREAANYKVTDLLRSITKGERLAGLGQH